MNGKEVVMLFPGAGIGDHVFGSELSGFLNAYYRQHGVKVLPGETVAGLERRDGQIALRTAGAGSCWSTALLPGSGLHPTSR
jgi:3-phenylpropionate/trans-cinnamate dioxygenase ferredoxin reductase component